MLALPRIDVFVEIGAVKFRQRVRVLREMRRHPIHDHADAGLMAASTKWRNSSGVPKRLVGA